MKRKKAKRMREIIEKEMVKEKDDKVLSEVPNLLPTMKYDGAVIQANTPIQWDGVVMRAKVTLYDREEFNPVNSPDSWAEIKYVEGYRVIPEKFDAGDVFKKGEIGYWDGKLYEAVMDNVVWNPKEYPSAWKMLDKQ